MRTVSRERKAEYHPFFGRIAIEKGFISKKHLNTALSDQKRFSLKKSSLKLRVGEVLFGNGVISKKQINIVLDEQNRIISSVDNHRNSLAAKKSVEKQEPGNQIVTGMTKQDVQKLTSKVPVRVWYTADDQEVWFVQDHKKHNIYFRDGKVEKVRYME